MSLDTKFTISRSFSEEVDVKNILRELKTIISQRSESSEVFMKDGSLRAIGKIKGSQLIRYEVDIKVTEKGLILDCELYKSGFTSFMVIGIIMGFLFPLFWLLLIFPVIRLPKNRNDSKNAMNEIVERIFIL